MARAARLQLTSTGASTAIVTDCSPGPTIGIVWPGYGQRSAARYGREVGTSTFVVVKTS